MKEFFRRASEQKAKEFREEAEARAEAQQRFLKAIEEHHAELSSQWKQGQAPLPPLDIYIEECLGLVRNYRELRHIEIPEEVGTLTGQQRRRLLRDFRKEKREAERILDMLKGEMKFGSVREMIVSISSELAYRLRNKKNSKK